MKITYVTLFPELFDGFIHVSKMDRAIVDNYIEVGFVNPRDFCVDRHQQVDDEIYGGNTGLLIKAQPVIEAVEKAISDGGKDLARTLIVYPSPSQQTFTQVEATDWGQQYDHLVFVCGRYEGIDHRFDLYMQDRYPDQFKRISLGQFVVFGGEAPSMVMTEAVVRLLPGVITHFPHEESYDVGQNLSNLEYPQYTRPQEVYGYSVPEVLLSGHHKNIQQWNEENSKQI